MKSALSFAVVMFVSTIASAAIVDLGTQGKTYKITERPLIDVIAERAADVNWTRETERVRGEIDGMYAYNLDRPLCASDKKNVVKNEVTVPYDVPDNKGGLAFRAGQKLTQTLPADKSFAICFVDGARDHKSQLRAIDKADLGCDLVVSNIDSREFSDKSGRKASPMHPFYLTRANIDCFPSAVRFSGDKIENYAFKPIEESK
jgi:hypothetical protein